MMKNPVLLLPLCALVFAAPRIATAASDPLLKCASSKLKAASKKESGWFNCLSKDAAKPDPTTLSACIAKLESKFGPAFTKADAKGACIGDPTTVENSINSDGPPPTGCIPDVTALIPPTDQTITTPLPKCTSAKLKAMGKGAGGELNCYSKAVSKSLDVDQTCLQKARDGVTTSFGKADAKGACPGDPAATNAVSDEQCVTLVNGEIKGKAPLVCGNGVIEPSIGETCDDGPLNGTPNDSCPSNCKVLSCTAQSGTSQQTSVTYTGPAGVTIAGIAYLVDYPENKVSKPTFAGKFQVSLSTKDLTWGYSGNAIQGQSNALPSPFMTATFETCQGAPAAVASDFTCKVTDASDDQGNTVDPTTLTCTVTIP
jgi:cysteine-rich repeat protein